MLHRLHLTRQTDTPPAFSTSPLSTLLLSALPAPTPLSVSHILTFRIVVLPALSRPKMRRRISFSFCFTFCEGGRRRGMGRGRRGRRVRGRSGVRGRGKRRQQPRTARGFLRATERDYPTHPTYLENGKQAHGAEMSPAESCVWG